MSATASSASTSVCWTCVRACCAARPSGSRRRDGSFACRSTRMVSFTQRAIVAIVYEVEPLDDAAQVVVQSELVTNETLPVTEKDPRAAAALASPLSSDMFGGQGLRAFLVHTTKASGLTSARRWITGSTVRGQRDDDLRIDPDLARVTITATVAPGAPLRVTKFVGYGWSGTRTVPALRDQVSAALARRRPHRLAGPPR